MGSEGTDTSTLSVEVSPPPASDQTQSTTQQNQAFDSKNSPKLNAQANEYVPALTSKLRAKAEEFVPVSQWTTPPPPPLPASGAEQPSHKYSLNFLMSFRGVCLDPPQDLHMPYLEVPKHARHTTHLSRQGRQRSPSVDNMVERKDLFFQQDLHITKSRHNEGLDGAAAEPHHKDSPAGLTTPKKSKRRSRGGRKSSPTPPASPVTPVRPLRHVDDDETSKACREFRVLLNKLTPDNMDRIVSEALKINISSVTSLQAVIQVLFDKAVSESHFCAAYADLCSRLCDAMPDFASSGSKKQTFRRILLGLCYTHFISEGDMSALTFSSSSPCSPIADPILISLETAMNEEERHRVAKQRVMGNIQFIGALYLHNLLTEQVIHLCFDYVLDDLQQVGQEDVEAACRLIAAVGHKLQQHSKSYLEQLFAKLDEIRKNPQMGSRISFMLDDLSELWARNWVPRRQPTINPKPLTQLRREQDDHAGDKGQQEMHELKERSRKSGAQPWRATRDHNKPAVPQPKAVALEDWRRKAIMMVEEYFLIGDINEACRSVLDLTSSGDSRLFVKIASMNLLESDPKSVGIWAALLATLHTKQLLASDDIHQGLSDVWERMHDLAIDAPLAPETLAVLCGSLCASNVITADELLSEVMVFSEVSQVAIPRLIARAISECQSQSNHELTCEKWRNSALTLTDLKLNASHNHFFLELGVSWVLDEKHSHTQST
eukprot:c8302_g1_i2.p1 GENE.c8302_g1_i2~~c8302_g1_i2.p1  ORF type:complete len:718 (+),score=207.10 c8302_g1_i2:45-2198(+)